MKKGQAAMEFLITYGWAILAAILVIGALAYVAFKPSTIVPNQCIVSAPFTCEAGAANSTGVALELRNGGGEAFTVSSIAVAGCGSKADVGEVADGALTKADIACALSAGKFKGDITVTYRKAGSTIDLTSTGTLVDKVE